MFTKTLLPDTLRAVRLVSSYPEIKTAYLAGGTALALQIGHRISVDLDFFTSRLFDSQILSTALSRHPEFLEDGQSWGTVWGKIGDTRFSLFYYKYPLIEPPDNFSGLHVLKKPDIAAMKLHALEDRGTKRDFIDIFFLAKEYTMEQIFDFYNQKYSCLDAHLISLIKSLNYFEDAEHEDWEPNLLIKVDWSEVKAFFNQEAKRLAQKQLGL